MKYFSLNANTEINSIRFSNNQESKKEF